MDVGLCDLLASGASAFVDGFAFLLEGVCVADINDRAFLVVGEFAVVIVRDDIEEDAKFNKFVVEDLDFF